MLVQRSASLRSPPSPCWRIGSGDWGPVPLGVNCGVQGEARFWSLPLFLSARIC